MPDLDIRGRQTNFSMVRQFETGVRLTVPTSIHFSNSSGGTLEPDFLGGLEQQLKDAWSQYVAALDQRGPDESTNCLRDRYFKLYRKYRQNLRWRRAIGP